MRHNQNFEHGYGHSQGHGYGHGQGHGYGHGHGHGHGHNRNYNHGQRQRYNNHNNNSNSYYRYRNDFDINQIVEQVKGNSDSLKFTNYDISDLDLRILACEIKQNLTEQRDRAYSVRFTNHVIPPEIGTAREACLDIYKKYVKPAMARAHADQPGLMETVPSFLELWDAGHEVPVRRRQDDKPFPFLFKFRSRAYVELFMEYADESLLDKEPVEDTVTVKGDLTAIHRDCMTALKQDESVEKFWMTGQAIKYTQYNSERVHVVTNPLGTNRQEMAIKPTPRNRRVRCNRRPLNQEKYKKGQHNLESGYKGFSRHQEFVNYDNDTYAAAAARKGPQGRNRQPGSNGQQSGQHRQHQRGARNIVRGGALMRKVPSPPATGSNNQAPISGQPVVTGVDSQQPAASNQQSAASNQQPAASSPEASQHQLEPEPEKRSSRSTNA